MRKYIGKIINKCQACGKSYNVWPHLADKSKYCSKECHYHPKQIKKYCKSCNKEFVSAISLDRSFCSRLCYDTTNIKMHLNCVICAKGFTVQKCFENVRKCCSKECRKLQYKNYPKGPKHHLYKDKDKRSPAVQQVIKELKKIKGACENCGTKKHLQGHHIIKYSERPDLGDDPNNIKILCIDCHALEHPELKELFKSFYEKKGININCKTCNKDFYIAPYLIRVRKYCSKECFRKTYPKKIIKRKYNKTNNSIDKSCIVCNNIFTVHTSLALKRETCSRICSGKIKSIQMKEYWNGKRNEQDICSKQ